MQLNYKLKALYTPRKQTLDFHKCMTTKTKTAIEFRELFQLLLKQTKGTYKLNNKGMKKQSIVKVNSLLPETLLLPYLHTSRIRTHTLT